MLRRPHVAEGQHLDFSWGKRGPSPAVRAGATGRACADRGAGPRGRARPSCCDRTRCCRARTAARGRGFLPAKPPVYNRRREKPPGYRVGSTDPAARRARRGPCRRRAAGHSEVRCLAQVPARVRGARTVPGPGRDDHLRAADRPAVRDGRRARRLVFPGGAAEARGHAGDVDRHPVGRRSAGQRDPGALRFH